MDQQLLIVSVTVGVVVAGAVWLFWSFMENVIHMFRNPRSKRATSGESTDIGGRGEGI